MVAGGGKVLGEVNIISSPRELTELRGSKYHFIPINKALRFVKENEGEYAFVTLPCQTHGLRKVQNADEVFEKRIKLIIGLFCGTNKNFSATRYLLSKLDVKDLSKVSNLSYRAKQWEGIFSAELKDGEKKELEPREWVFFHLLFSTYRCAFCFDLTNMLSDVSVGDAWFKDLKCSDCGKYSCKHCKDGYSFVLVRKELDYLPDFLEREGFEVRERNAEHYPSFQSSTRNLKNNSFYRMNLVKDKPKYDFSYEMYEASEFYERLFLHSRKFFSNKKVLSLLEKLPLKIPRVFTSQFISDKII